jgi:prepilin-type N-terminal cleavage/methylation domain-containing protein/prepilin-type processing-associated H-X9-DG protein
MKKQTRYAFTLIELLVVIAIIAILAAILFPVFAQAKAAAKKTNDLSQMKQLATSNLLYSADADDNALVFPYAAAWSTPAYTNGEKGLHWADRLMPYTKSKGIFADPSNTEGLYRASGYWRPGANSPTDADPSRVYRVTYTFNHLISRADLSPDTPGSTSFTAIPEVADTVLMGPSQNWFSWSSCQSGGGNVRNLHWNVSTGGWGYEMWGGPEGGYTKGANFAFADGHGKYSRLVRGADVAQGASGTLYVAYFVGAKTKPNVRQDGTCPTNLGAESF